MSGVNDISRMGCFWSLELCEDVESHRINVVFNIYKKISIKEAEKWNRINQKHLFQEHRWRLQNPIYSLISKSSLTMF